MAITDVLSVQASVFWHLLPGRVENVLYVPGTMRRFETVHNAIRFIMEVLPRQQRETAEIMPDCGGVYRFDDFVGAYETMIGLQDELLERLRSWADRNGNVGELWLFGSRAQGCALLESDFDLAIALAPPDGEHNWALGNYTALGDDWQRELAAIVGRNVSLEAIEANSEGDTAVRSTGVRLWVRE